MVFSTQSLFEISIAGAKSEHSEWRLNPEMEGVIEKACLEIDTERAGNDYDVFTNVDDAGNGTISLKESSTGDNVKSWVFDEVFIIE